MTLTRNATWLDAVRAAIDKNVLFVHRGYTSKHTDVLVREAAKDLSIPILRRGSLFWKVHRGRLFAFDRDELFTRNAIAGLQLEAVMLEDGVHTHLTAEEQAILTASLFTWASVDTFADRMRRKRAGQGSI